MIKVYNGGYEVAKEYYFQYEGNKEIYSNSVRIITGSLVIKNNTELETIDMLNNIIDSFLVIVEPMQVGYMVNLLQVRDIAFSNTMASGDVIYTITGAKKMRPRKAREVKLVPINGIWPNFSANVLVSATVDEYLTTAGYIRMADGVDIRYIWGSDNKITDLPNEIGKCRIETGDNFYITQTGGTNVKMQMPSKSGQAFPNGKVTFNNSTLKFKGQRLEIN